MKSAAIAEAAGRAVLVEKTAMKHMMFFRFRRQLQKMPFRLFMSAYSRRATFVPIMLAMPPSLF
jgi:hypothetical protein